VPYTHAFFAFQVEVARILVRRFDLTLLDALFHYTTFSKTALCGADWAVFAEGLTKADHPASYAANWYSAHRDPDPAPDDTVFHGRPLFGCFYCIVRDETVIRPHFIKNDRDERPLSASRMAARCAELGAMFAHIQQHEPQATTVQGNSWLYNLHAYRRLFPPSYTAELPESNEGEFQFLARWGQLFDRDWDVRQPHGERFLHALEHLERLDDLQHCFRDQILRPRCAITDFYEYYGLTTARDEEQHQ
jgi:hypothetical protein